MSWDPDRYLAFADQRTRPGEELLARIPDLPARRIVDLGCGTGHLTAMLAHRWEAAEVLGIDNSDEMIRRARRDHPALRFIRDDITTWTSSPPADVVFSNAALHWLDDHHRLFPRLMQQLSPDGVLAVQMPDNWSAPTHTLPAAILDDGGWPVEAVRTLLRNRVHPPDSYRMWLAPAARAIDQWDTTYYQVLSGDDPVLRWVEGSVLAPVLACLDGEDRDRFRHACRLAYRDAYPAGADGLTVLPFRRRFLLAVRR